MSHLFNLTLNLNDGSLAVNSIIIKRINYLFAANYYVFAAKIPAANF